MSWTHPDLETIADLVSKRTGLSFAIRQSGVEVGIRRAMERMRIPNLVSYATRLAQEESVMDDLINELTVGETYFFREPAHYQVIQRVILPEIIQRRGTPHPIRAWSASCASGEEAYSLAILFQQQGISAHAHLVATDISVSALAKARQAVYGPWSLRGDDVARAQTKPPLAALPYLIAEGKTYRLDETIRRRVALSHLNLALDAYPSFVNGIWGMDLILCRNVLIYFDRDTIRQVAQRLFQTLAEGGWLITASSDPPLWDHAPFEVVTLEEGVFYRRSSREQSRVESPESRVNSPESEVVQCEESKVVDSRLSTLDSRRSTILDSGLSTSLDEARAAFASGDYFRVVQLTSDSLDDPVAAALHVRALANHDPVAAIGACAQGANRHSLCAELHYLHAVLLLDARKHDDAIQAVRRVLYLDRTLAIAHFTLGSILSQQGDRAGAQRAYRNARDLCATRPPDERVPLADGESAGRLFEVAGAELALLEGTGDA